jgi:hypothetical protein
MHEGFLTKGWNRTLMAQAVVLGVRNNLIKRFLDNRVLVPYLTEQCAEDVSNFKVEVIQRDLEKLLSCGMSQLPKYKSVVDSVKLAGSEEPARSNEGMFFPEIERVLRKYVNLHKQLPIWN